MTLITKKIVTNNYVSDDLFSCGMSKKMCFYAIHFRDPNHPSGRPILVRNVYFGTT